MKTPRMSKCLMCLRLTWVPRRRRRTTVATKRKAKEKRPLENPNLLRDQQHLHLSPSFESVDWAGHPRISRRAGMTMSREIPNRERRRREGVAEVALAVEEGAGPAEEALRMLPSSLLTRRGT
jgi:hypothetical protein